jgi:hypothetical protein
MPPEASSEPGLPLADALDDVQMLARLHETETPRLALDLGLAACSDNSRLELSVLGLERANLRAPRDKCRASVDVRAKRPVVQEPDDYERGDGRPT